MKRDHASTSDVPGADREKEFSRKHYQKPELRVLGAVHLMVRGGGFSGADAMTMMMMA